MTHAGTKLASFIKKTFGGLSVSRITASRWEHQSWLTWDGPTRRKEGYRQVQVWRFRYNERNLQVHSDFGQWGLHKGW